MALFSRDTRDGAQLAQIRAHQALTGAERHMLGVELSDMIRDIALAGLRERHPNLPEQALVELFLERFKRPRFRADAAAAEKQE